MAADEATGAGPGRPPRIDGVLETALYVDDLDRAAAFYDGHFGFPRLFGDERLIAYYAGHRTVLLLFKRGGTREPQHMPGGTIPPHDGSGPVHVAFAVSVEALAEFEAQFAAAGIAIEGRTRWPRGSDSIYFRDPDGHLLELATPGLWATY